MLESTRVGTVIDEASAIYLETFVKEAGAAGPRILTGRQRPGTPPPPTLIAQDTPACPIVARDALVRLPPSPSGPELERKQNHSATVIQKFWRRHAAGILVADMKRQRDDRDRDDGTNTRIRTATEIQVRTHPPRV